MRYFPGYEESHEQEMRTYFRSLPEDHRRRYAAVEAQKIGFGGVAYISEVLAISRQTIYTGIRELEDMCKDDPDHPQRPSGGKDRIRRRGGGRRKEVERQAGLEGTAESILEAHSAGSPTDENVRWTDLKPLQLAQELVSRGFEIGRNTAAKLLDRAGYRRRSLRKELITGHVDPHERDQQFRHIDELRRRAHAQGIPVLCVDTKKKETLGKLYRPGQCYSTDIQRVYDHDFRHLASATLVPHGVYDYFENVGFMTLGTSRETSAFVCDAIALAWEQAHRHRYPQAPEILLTFDAGGANSVRSLRFKEDLVGLSTRLGLPLRIAHYPPYTSKWHPIEHRLFSQVERALHGIILDSPETALQAVQRTSTTTGLRVTARILDRAYTLGRKCSDTFNHIKDKFIRHDDVRGEWNYLVDANGVIR
jgi:hypothetical protein